MDPVIQCLIDDDPIALAEEAPEGFFLLPPPIYLPEILRSNPSLTGLAAYYGAKKCLLSIIQLNAHSKNK